MGCEGIIVDTGGLDQSGKVIKATLTAEKTTNLDVTDSTSLAVNISKDASPNATRLQTRCGQSPFVQIKSIICFEGFRR